MAGYDQLLEAVRAGVVKSETVVVATILRNQRTVGKLVQSGAEVLSDCFLIDIGVDQHVLNLVSRTLESGRETDLVEIGSGLEKLTVVIEVIRPKPALVIFGAGHVGQALATVGALTGYDTTLVDDREAFVTRERVPDPRIHLVASAFVSAGSIPISSNSAVVIVTRGHQHDEICLRETINSPARYIGMIGSKRRVIGVFRRLQASGIDQALLERVRAPIGLDLGARSPQEIAIAILAEIIQTFNSHLKKNWERAATKINRKE
ncbi:MAG TPA: XdhC family protein [Blastocatellia bacterium]|nr:XdhC family protein [Blastocatellia bacterium]